MLIKCHHRNPRGLAPGSSQFCQRSGEEEYKCDALDKLYCKIEKCRFYKTPETVAEEKEKEKERKLAKAKEKMPA